jgi:hypothetical protein
MRQALQFRQWREVSRGRRGWRQALSFFGISWEGGKDLPKGFLFAGGFGGQGCVVFDWESVESFYI